VGVELGWKGGGKGDWSQGEEDKGDSFDFFGEDSNQV